MASLVRRKNWLLAVLAIFCSVLVYIFLPNIIPEAGRRVAAIFTLAVFFWAFEIIPLYATSVVVILLLTFLLARPEGVLGFGKTGYQFFLIPFSNPVIILFLGGFVLAQAVRKHQVDFFIMEKVLAKVGTRSHILVISFLVMSAFFSMWISNTAATAMMLVLIQPILANIKHSDPARKGLVLATALGANIGGIATPIGTPPNALAIGILAEYGIDLDFVSWIIMGVPLVVVLLIIAAGVLLFFFPPHRKKVPYTLTSVPRLTRKGKWVSGVALFIIACWLTTPLHHVPEPIIALLGVGLFTAFRLITAQDFRTIDWDILVLMWGGLALGEGLQISGLIEAVINLPVILKQGIGLIVSLSILAVILSSFISNTATANLLLPLAINITPIHKTAITITVALACSFALAFPISTPPNAMAYSTGEIGTKDLFKAGGVMTLISLLLVIFGIEFVIPRALHLFF